MATTKEKSEERNTLISIQQELKAKKDKYNKFGKYHYRSAESILESLKPLLDKHKSTLIVNDEVKQVGDFIFIESTVTLRTENKEVSAKAQAGIEKAGGMALPQAFGSASSYSKKYALGNLFLIDDTEDSDATNTHGKDNNPVSKPNTQPKHTAKTKSPITDLEPLKKVLKTSKDKALRQLESQRTLTKTQAKDLVDSKLVTKAELSNVEIKG